MGRSLRKLLTLIGHCVLAGRAGALGNAPDQDFAVHGQFTYVEQDTSDFHSPYAGANSLSPRQGSETIDATLYTGARMWQGAEVWMDAELDQGFGLDKTLGVAGFPSGEAYKVGKNQPYLRLQRLFVRQTVDLADDGATVDGAAAGDGTATATATATDAATGGDAQTATANQLAGAYSDDRLVITLGKFAVVDIFDTNRYASNPKVDFLNWTAINAGTFDYAADAWGYTVGAALEWYRGAWALRGGLFDLSNVPNSARLEPAFHEFQGDFELEHRHRVAGRQGRLLLTMFDSRGRMGLLDEAVLEAQRSGGAVDPATVRGYRSRIGASLNLEQQLFEHLGLFARLGKAQGNVETYEFTDVDRTLSTGVQLDGGRWKRSMDTVGVALIDNKASAARERFLAAGGLGLLVGDGQLPRPGPEQIIESYYSLGFGAAQLSLDYQWIEHPAYNRERGPASVVAVRLHAQF